MTTSNPACPLCRLPLGVPGRWISAFDTAGQDFVFVVCCRCAVRLGRLPLAVQRKQMAIAIQRLADRPERHPYRLMSSAAEADMLTVLLAEMPGQAEALRLLTVAA